MKTAKHLPPALAVEALDALLQLHREGDTKAVASFLAGLDEVPDEAAAMFVSGLIQIARG
ncbi:hypothetical protein LHP98_19065 [Rhodobacter sp. Har01]|uniref:hypothetical protein n=1 Tax=Rhodobacter sp. Har01 TaxID=2883999 RepID=UPI001D092FA9|nr:hypothetical protein [Rhodobacter sp. Har01]MCB6180217.1 hypothetical protein [Rhodobacter sp. Har01]